ncbi:MAG: hypothetical protein Q9208_003123 [Pyrenodesmia sp. 3 TL-2023]
MLGLIPVAVWNLVPEHPAITFVCFARSENLLTGLSTSSEQLSTAIGTKAPERTAAEDEDTSRTSEMRQDLGAVDDIEYAMQAHVLHPSSPDSDANKGKEAVDDEKGGEDVEENEPQQQSLPPIEEEAASVYLPPMPATPPKQDDPDGKPANTATSFATLSVVEPWCPASTAWPPEDGRRQVDANGADLDIVDAA